MKRVNRVECVFLIPLTRDKEISDGNRHAPQAWRWLNDEFYCNFDGITIAPGVYKGIWKSTQTGLPVHDKTRKFVVALPKNEVAKLRAVL